MNDKGDGGTRGADDATVSRRGALKLASAVASLGAGLGVVFGPHEASAAAEGGRLQLKFWRLPEGADESKAELVATFRPTPEEEARLAVVPQGRLQLKLSIMQGKIAPSAHALDDWEARAERENDGGVTRVVLVKQILPLDTSRLEIKLGQVQIKRAAVPAAARPTGERPK